MTEPTADPPSQPGLFPATGPNSLASVGQRFVARLVDGIVLAAPAVLLLLSHIDLDADRAVDAPLWASVVATVLIPVIYETVLIATRGQTVGKATMRIRVARLADGANPTIFQAGIRVLLPVALGNLPIGFIATVLFLAVYLVALGNPLRQGWHDRAAGTVVVRTR